MRGSMLFLQAITVLIGIGVLIVMIWFPQLEGRNAHATQFEIYFKDPFLAYAYIASIPFFTALSQIFKLLGAAGQNKLFSKAALNAFRRIRVCAISLIGFILVGAIILLCGESDDRPPIVGLGILASLACALIAAAAAMFERILSKDNLTA